MNHLTNYNDGFVIERVVNQNLLLDPSVGQCFSCNNSLKQTMDINVIFIIKLSPYLSNDD